MKKTLYILSMVVLCLALSSWGSKGHRKISQNFAPCLPAQLSFLKPAWTDYVMNHASDADYRKSQDPDEKPRHFIDIDNYEIFVLTGRIPQTYDSVVNQFGYSFVIDQGILPWSTMITFDSLKNCFQRRDWTKAEKFAADLGHYVGDGHMPLHITKNYNGQLTGQYDIHSRYESTMVATYEAQLVYPVDSAAYIEDVGEFVFAYLYANYAYVDSILLADTYARNLAGGTGSAVYYQALWEKTGGFTKQLMQHASTSLASLVYTAWVRAGSPKMNPNAVTGPENADIPRLLPVFPNPVSQSAGFSFTLPHNGTAVTLIIYDNRGSLKETVLSGTQAAGMHTVNWSIQGYPPGIYLCKFTAGTSSVTQRFIVIR